VEIRFRGTGGGILFRPATGQLTYSLIGGGFTAATIHRGGQDHPGPAIMVLATHPFDRLVGHEILSALDREKLMSGELYLRAARRAPGNEVRIPLKPL
jgi:hypothetical protein